MTTWEDLQKLKVGDIIILESEDAQVQLLCEVTVVYPRPVQCFVPIAIKVLFPKEYKKETHKLDLTETITKAVTILSDQDKFSHIKHLYS